MKNTIKIDNTIALIVKSDVILELTKDYYIKNKDRFFITSDKVIENIISYLKKCNMTYHINQGLVTLDGDFYCQYSNPSDYPRNYDEALEDFIFTIRNEVLDLIQNKYFDNEKQKWNI